MKVTIESTTKITSCNGVPCRIWEGVSEGGVAVICFITRVLVKEGQDVSQFESELLEQKKPSPDAEAIPLRLIL